MWIVCHMKYQDLFSLKNENIFLIKIESRLQQILHGVLKTVLKKKKKKKKRPTKKSFEVDK